ncbi:aldehyde dehydrogenase (NADP(+)) [Chitinophaga varians]|uniref:aldehyde dehydrogenase (NADP(+)) n=1 Tax=Chitinophaga varians TaxID=2202339 RepID=UPI00165FB205|nr:aldehyde dehydrogenase (NADP(+)) [Chitinophaga varians]MBC9914818.1 aldehyde dehydrogenase (NADP(+)) [Chitinophaga varians]
MQIDQIMQQAATAYDQYKKIAPLQRAAFLETIGAEITARREALVKVAGEETNLPMARLNGEIVRTTTQLQKFADLIKEGSWVEAVIDTTPNIRRMLVPVGPVVVFGASNFPFAFSTAGGDTASALAAGATVVVKGHPAHPRTSLLMFEAIQAAMVQSGMPAYTVQHVTGDYHTGKALVVHPYTTGVGFTGSLQGGKALCAYAAEREVPIPVFAEMSSVNPVVFLPQALETRGAELAETFAASITLGAGQFCTNPGLLIGLESPAFTAFQQQLGAALEKTAPQKMLHPGIHSAFLDGRSRMLANQEVTLSPAPVLDFDASTVRPSLATTSGVAILANPALKEEVFGPHALLIACKDKAELLAVLSSLKGQLTTSVMATEEDLTQWQEVIDIQVTLAGRIILNGAPTGVEVCAAMVHGGPFPATSDARFTSVGTAAIRRWVRPVCFQQFPDTLLPDELKDANPRGIWRLTDNQYSR